MVFTFFTNKTIFTKPIFGQPYLTASGYDDQHEELHHKKEVNISVTSVAKTVQIATGVMDHFADYQELCTVFRTTNFDLLKLIASEKSNIENILKFIYQHQGRWSLICNLNIICQEATLQYHSKSKSVTRPIQKILLGHSVILCVPLANRISNTYEITHYVQSLIERKSNGSFPEYLLAKAAAFIDYKEIIKMPAFEILNGLSEYSFPDELTSLLVELPEIEKKYSFKNSWTNERLAITIILKLKKLMYLMEVKFGFVRNHNIGRTILRDDERRRAAEDIVLDIGKLKDAMNFSSFPPPDFISLYHHCCFYEKQWFTALYDETELPPIYSSLERHLETVYIFLRELPFKKTGNIWFMRVNNDNANEYRLKYLIDKMSILFTPKTRSLVDDFINENIVHVLSTETKWENSTEPVLSLSGATEILFGMSTPAKTRKETIRNGNIFLDFCKCKTDAEPKAWVCEKCKLLLRYVDDKFVYCECGVQKTADLVKKCFKCADEKMEVDDDGAIEATKYKFPEEESKTKNKENGWKKVEASAVEESHEVKEKVKNEPVKNEYNILFIGQSGAGKSMLVNSIYNYLTYNFDEVAKADEVNCILPCQFQLQKPNFEKVVFRAGPQDDNEHFNDEGESVTQKPKIYSFTTDAFNCNVIDTPGLGDTRGAKQDEQNLNLIRETAIDINKLHAICFVMPSNISKLTANFEVSMRDLLSLFPKTALQNVFFFFTYANSTFFTIGDTRSSLEAFIKNFQNSNSAEIPFGIENVCCVDSEAFMYFIATKQGHKYQNRDQESFRMSWDKSKKAIETFLSKLHNINGIKSDDISMNYELEQIGILMENEEDPTLVKIFPDVIATISNLSMTSRFNTLTKMNSNGARTVRMPHLFDVLEKLQKYIKNNELNEMIKKLIEKHGHRFMDKSAPPTPSSPPPSPMTEKPKLPARKSNESNIRIVKKETKKEMEWPCMTCLKKVAEKLATEWIQNKLPKEAKEVVYEIQLASNLKQNDIVKKDFKRTLDDLLWHLDGHKEMKAEVEQLLKNRNE